MKTYLGRFPVTTTGNINLTLPSTLKLGQGKLIINSVNYPDVNYEKRMDLIADSKVECIVNLPFTNGSNAEVSGNNYTLAPDSPTTTYVNGARATNAPYRRFTSSQSHYSKIKQVLNSDFTIIYELMVENTMQTTQIYIPGIFTIATDYFTGNPRSEYSLNGGPNVSILNPMNLSAYSFICIRMSNGVLSYFVNNNPVYTVSTSGLSIVDQDIAIMKADNSDNQSMRNFKLYRGAMSDTEIIDTLHLLGY